MFRRMLPLVTLLLILGVPAAHAVCGPGREVAPADDPDSGTALIGTPAPPWTFTRWIGRPMTLQQLRGKVVLLRWWNLDCHFCEATLPELESLRGRYTRDGLVVIGVFHPKPPHPVRDADVRRAAESRGFHGTLAIDQEWETLSRYWLAGHDERNWTSVSFLIDRDGRIAWVQGGGEYHHSDDPRHARCEAQARDLEGLLDRMLGHAGGAATTATP